MLAKRIIPCLDVKNGRVVKGVNFKNHKDSGGILELAKRYEKQGADELVFYDISASTNGTTVSLEWVEKVAENLSIPFCVAGGIKSVDAAEKILQRGADKISINTPALDNPFLISDLASRFGSQCVVVGIDSSLREKDYRVWQNTGSEKTAKESGQRTLDWISRVISLGAGEIVLNCMGSDGCRNGFDLAQLKIAKKYSTVPLIASGGAGKVEDFKDVFNETNVEGALAASVFHNNVFTVGDLKGYLQSEGIAVRRE